MSNKKKKTWARLRHRFWMPLLRPVARVFLYFKIGFVSKKPKLPKEQYVVMSNHNTDLDVVMLYCMTRGPLHFVASDHILKWKPWGAILKYLAEPIPIVRAQLDIKAVRDVLRCAKEGGSIGIFPEGGCSYTGKTEPIAPATAKLIKQLGLALYLFKLDGTFLTYPGCSYSWRRGKTFAKLSCVLTAQQVKEMPLPELEKCIEENLFVDSYAFQREHMIPYKGKAYAYGLETSLYQCPKCLEIGRMKGEGDFFRCECGYEVKWNKYGFFEGKEVIFDNLTDWDTWQREEIERRIREGIVDLSGKEPILTDENEILILAERAHDTGELGRGQLRMYSDRFELTTEEKNFVWHFSEIEKLRASERTHLIFSVGGDTYYEFRTESKRSSYKYMLWYKALRRYQKEKNANE